MRHVRDRDFLKQCPNHGIPKHEITQIFYDGLGVPDIYFSMLLVEAHS